MISKLPQLNTSHALESVVSGVLSAGLLEQRDLPLLDQYARERYLPVTNSLVLQYMAYKASNGQFDLVSFMPVVQVAKNAQKADLASYVGEIHSCGLISDRDSERLLKWGKQFNSLSKAEVLAMAAAVTQYSEFMHPDRLLVLLGTLRTAQIADPARVDGWQNSIQAQKVSSHLDLLALCLHNTVIEPDTNPEDTDAFLLELFEATAAVLPQLSFDDFSWSWVVKSEGIGDAICVQMKIQGEYFRLLFDVVRSKDHPNRIIAVDPRAYYKIFNKALIDQGSEYRLHYVDLSVPPFVVDEPHDSKWGILALKQSQANSIHSLDPQAIIPRFNISTEQYEPAITTAEWQSMVKTLDESGVLHYLNPAEIFRYGEDAFQHMLIHYSDLLVYFPDLVLIYDGETGVHHEPYTHLLLGLERISHGHFTPEDIEEETGTDDPSRVHLSFTVKGKYYSKLLSHSGTSYDDTFWSLIGRVCTEMYTGRAFYDVSSDPSHQKLIFLTDMQKAAFEKIAGLTVKDIV